MTPPGKGINPVVPRTCVLHIFAFGNFFGEFDDELCNLSASEAQNAFNYFIELMTKCFRYEYLRCPRDADLQIILSTNESGCFWLCWLLGLSALAMETFPSALAVNVTGRSSKPSVLLERIADDKLWIWGLHYRNHVQWTTQIYCTHFP